MKKAILITILSIICFSSCNNVVDIPELNAQITISGQYNVRKAQIYIYLKNTGGCSFDISDISFAVLDSLFSTEIKVTSQRVTYLYNKTNIAPRDTLEVSIYLDIDPLILCSCYAQVTVKIAGSGSEYWEQYSGRTYLQYSAEI